VLAANYHSVRIRQLAARYRYECPMHLVDIWDITMALAREHGRFPEDLTSITRKVPISQYDAQWRSHPVLCPGSEAICDAKRATVESFGYAYVNWSARGYAHAKDVPGAYPLIYDRTLSNHFGRGIFVVKVNGSVIWDPAAEWVRDFSNRHPEYRLENPQ
jgi:hypothetical protein